MSTVQSDSLSPVQLFSPAPLGTVSARSEHFTTSDGTKLRYLESGTGDTILFVPGWMMPAEIWQPQIEHFCKAYHVVVVDERKKRDGRPLAVVGSFDPKTKPERIKLEADAIDAWVKKGAHLSPTVKSLLRRQTRAECDECADDGR